MPVHLFHDSPHDEHRTLLQEIMLEYTRAQPTKSVLVSLNVVVVDLKLADHKLIALVHMLLVALVLGPGEYIGHEPGCVLVVTVHLGCHDLEESIDTTHTNVIFA